MLQSILNTVFGCSHSKTTFPITPQRMSNSTYVVCLDCGKEFAYNWDEMRVGQAVSSPVPVSEVQPLFR